MNLVVTWKLNFATCLSFCGNRSQIVCYVILLDSEFVFIENVSNILHMWINQLGYRKLDKEFK